MERREKFAKAGLSAAHETRELLRITQNARFALIIGSSRNVTALKRQVRMANSGFRIYAMAYSARMRFFVLVYLFAAVTSLHAQTPFDFGSTPGKLPKQLRPTDYAIWFKPDLKRLTFSGHEIVKLNVEEPGREIILNALDLTITDAEIDNKTVPKTAIKFDAKNELLTIATPGELTP